jgi:hypothetical protein
MTKLIWDRIGERLFEVGVDRGVLYLSDSSGVSWNGLTSVDEDTGDDTSNPVYFDGIKYLDVPLIGDYSATINAFTYPDEFLEFEGITELGEGLYVDGQDSKLFGLSYRTLVGNDLEGIDYGYKIHLVFNLTAIPDSVSYETVSESPNPIQFSWKITGIPEEAPGYRPTAHVIFDSRFLNESMLMGIEAILYGANETLDVLDGGSPSQTSSELIDGGIPSSTDLDIVDGNVVTYSASVEPRLPTLPELIDFVSFWNPKLIVPQIVTGLAQIMSGMGDLTQTNVNGLYSALPSTKLIETEVEGLYHYTGFTD